MRYLIFFLILLLAGCTQNDNKFNVVSKDDFCRISFDSFKKNDLKQYLTLLRNEEDLKWLIGAINNYKPKNDIEKRKLVSIQGRLQKIIEYERRKMIEARKYATLKFPNVHSDGIKSGLDWNKAKMKKCIFKSMGGNPILKGAFIHIYVSHQGSVYMIENEAYQTGRGWRLKDYPRWKGKTQ